METFDSYLVFCQALRGSPLVDAAQAVGQQHSRPDYLIEARARMDAAERAWLAQTDIEPPDYEVMHRLFEAFKQAGSDYHAAWQRWNDEKAALLAELN